MKNRITFLLLLLIFISCQGQKSINDYVGGWAGTLNENNPFIFKIELDINEEDKSSVKFIGRSSTTELELKPEGTRYLTGRFENQLTIRIDTTHEEPIIYIQIGHHLAHINLEKNGKDKWNGQWDLLLGENIAPTLYLSIDQYDDGNYGASTFIKEPTFHYMMGQDFSLQENKFEFLEMRSNIQFEGILGVGKISLSLRFLQEEIKVEMLPFPYEDWTFGVPDASNNEPQKGSENFTRLINDISNDTLERTHSVVIAQKGEIIFEQYFDGFTKDTPHDTRSLSKSFASALVGVAIAKGDLKNENIPIKNMLESQYPNVDWSDKKDGITISHLLTMSSGLDAIDFGLNRQSYASEGTYQNQNNWVEYILSAPMIFTPGEVANYGSGSPHLVAPILASQIDERLEFYAYKNLLQPLRIQNYRIQANNNDQPYLGGGWYFTPRDLIKFGQLYMNGGAWNDRQIISKEWADKSLSKISVLENTNNKNEYGYLFWHDTYEVDGREIESVEARGSGGQYLFIIPELELVAVITSGNYRNNKGFQPERIMEAYILTEMLK